MSSYRTVHNVSEAPLVQDGEGVAIHRAFPNARLNDLDPFLLLDHMGPTEYGPGEAKGFPGHPHRGFETVTYLLQGEFEHRDSFGHKGVLRAGDVQWMTAGSGLVHSERPSKSFVESGGTLEGFQLWINLPKADKMKAPAYQEFSANAIPSASTGGSSARVVAGEALKTAGAVSTHIPIQFVHFTLQPGAALTHSVPRDLNAIVYVIRGAVNVNGTAAPRFHIAGLANDADQIQVSANEASEFLLLAAKPIHEPVARYGPFVMNTKAELQQAFEDYRAGKMGTI